MKILLVLFLLITTISCSPKKRDNMEQEYGVFNQTFSQLEPTSCLYEDMHLLIMDSTFNNEQKIYIKKTFFSKGIDTTNIKYGEIYLLYVKDSLWSMKYDNYGYKNKSKLNLTKINSKNYKTIIVDTKNKAFEKLKNKYKEIELSRVLFSKDFTKSVYEFSIIDYETMYRQRYLIFSNFKNEAWYIYKTEKKGYKYRP